MIPRDISGLTGEFVGPRKSFIGLRRSFNPPTISKVKFERYELDKSRKSIKIPTSMFHQLSQDPIIMRGGAKKCFLEV